MKRPKPNSTDCTRPNVQVEPTEGPWSLALASALPLACLPTRCSLAGRLVGHGARRRLQLFFPGGGANIDGFLLEIEPDFPVSTTTTDPSTRDPPLFWWSEKMWTPLRVWSSPAWCSGRMHTRRHDARDQSLSRGTRVLNFIEILEQYVSPASV